jgi:hypothetical protein
VIEMEMNKMKAMTSQGYMSGMERFASESLVRPRYYRGMVVTPEVPTLEQNYFLEKMRLHNRMLHGWGVVCGAQVCIAIKYNQNNQKTAEPWKVSISPGYLLAPSGDAILIQSERIVDLRGSQYNSASAAGFSELDDPYCVQRVPLRQRDHVFVAVSYHENPGRPVQSAQNGCGCGPAQCENSRIEDGYTIYLLDECPDSSKTAPDLTKLTFADLLLSECPACSDDPVVLAEVFLDRDGNVLAIDNCSCRRVVLSLANVWAICTNPTLTLAECTAADKLTPGATGSIRLTGGPFYELPWVDLGAGVKVNTVQIADEKTLLVNISLSDQAQPGPRTIRVITASCGVASMQCDFITAEIKAAPVPPVVKGAKRTVRNQ